MKVQIQFTDPIKLLRLFYALISVFFFFAFVYNAWVMPAAYMVVYVIQIFVCINYFDNNWKSKKRFNTSSEDFDEVITKYQKRVDILKKIALSIVGIVILCDLFPFIAMSRSICETWHMWYGPYKAGIWFYIMFLSVMACWGFFIKAMLKPENLMALIDVEVAKEKEREQQRIQSKIEAEKKREKDNQLYGKNHKKLFSTDSNIGTIIISEQNNAIYIKGKEYKFSDLLSCEVVDKSSTQTITTTTQGKAKTSTGSMLGRAAAGGILLGPVGAIIGGATAKKKIETKSDTSTITIHNYNVIIIVNSISEPIITVRIGRDLDKALQLQSTINVLINKN